MSGHIDADYIREAHRCAMLAKHEVFRAQDQASLMRDNRIARRLERRLAKVRSELEAIDRDVRQVVGVDAPLGAIPRRATP